MLLFSNNQIHWPIYSASCIPPAVWQLRIINSYTDYIFFSVIQILIHTNYKWNISIRSVSCLFPIDTYFSIFINPLKFKHQGFISPFLRCGKMFFVFVDTTDKVSVRAAARTIRTSFLMYHSVMGQTDFLIGTLACPAKEPIITKSFTLHMILLSLLSFKDFCLSFFCFLFFCFLFSYA